ncbi:uncharacterized protein LOC142222272 isoform X2 [Haematobia irritans]|uniref:uncharacterized protein LOC142222272 isoform X2 n=1 Tax=Haematobia irritans TaxID=7368 RepID=UPI003F506045
MHVSQAESLLTEQRSFNESPSSQRAPDRRTTINEQQSTNHQHLIIEKPTITKSTYRRPPYQDIVNNNPELPTTLSYQINNQARIVNEKPELPKQIVEDNPASPNRFINRTVNDNDNESSTTNLNYRNKSLKTILHHRTDLSTEQSTTTNRQRQS